MNNNYCYYYYYCFYYYKLYKLVQPLSTIFVISHASYVKNINIIYITAFPVQTNGREYFPISIIYIFIIGHHELHILTNSN